MRSRKNEIGMFQSQFTRRSIVTNRLALEKMQKTGIQYRYIPLMKHARRAVCRVDGRREGERAK